MQACKKECDGICTLFFGDPGSEYVDTEDVVMYVSVVRQVMAVFNWKQ